MQKECILPEVDEMPKAGILPGRARQLQLASKQHTASANNLIALLEQSFAGIRKQFDSLPKADGHQKWADFVSEYPHADCVRGMSLKKFTKSYQKW